MSNNEQVGMLEYLLNQTKEDLVNTIYNYRVSEIADFKEGEKAPEGDTDKRIPYIGWFWREIDFVNKRITIGWQRSFVGVMVNNKWDLPERDMTEGEATTFISFLDRAFAETISPQREAIYVEMRAWFQDLKIEVEVPRQEGAREKKFASFARMLLKEIDDAIGKLDPNQNERECAQALGGIIARRAYDFACHVAYQVGESDGSAMDCGLKQPQQIVNEMEDLTTWPEEKSA